MNRIANQNHKVDGPAKEVLAVVRRRWKLVLAIMLVDFLIKFLVKFMAFRKSAWLAQRDAAAAVVPEMVSSATPTTTRMVILTVADGVTSTACVSKLQPKLTLF